MKLQVFMGVGCLDLSLVLVKSVCGFDHVSCDWPHSA
jgi:hypothetical protein